MISHGKVTLDDRWGPDGGESFPTRIWTRGTVYDTKDPDTYQQTGVMCDGINLVVMCEVNERKSRWGVPYKSYRIPRRDLQSVIDALTEAKRVMDERFPEDEEVTE